MVLANAIHNTDTAKGAMIALIEGAFLSPFLLLVSLPLGLLGLKLGSLGRLRPHRVWISLLFANALWIFGIGSAIYDRANPERALKQWTNVNFPSDATLRSHFFFGGGFADDRHVFVFTCGPEETERLIRELQLAGGLLKDWQSEDRPEIAADGWVPAERWYISDLAGSPDYIELITDKTRTKVYLTFGQI